MLAATLGASLVGNMREGRGMKSKVPERETKISGLGVILAGEGRLELMKEQLKHVRIFNSTSFLILKYKTNLNLMVFIKI